MLADQGYISDGVLVQKSGATTELEVYNLFEERSAVNVVFGTALLFAHRRLRARVIFGGESPLPGLRPPAGQVLRTPVKPG
jgi:hypothetical protein